MFSILHILSLLFHFHVSVFSLPTTERHQTQTKIPSYSGTLGHTNRWLTDSEGNVITIHGLNFANKESPFTPQSLGFNEEDVAFLANEGFTTMRLWAIWSELEPAPGEYNDDYLTAIAEYIELLNSYGIKSIINFGQAFWGTDLGGIGNPNWAIFLGDHTATPKYSTNENWTNTIVSDLALLNTWSAFWSNEKCVDGVGVQDHFFNTWKYVIQFLKNRQTKGIVGYDPMNEPLAGLSEVQCLMPVGCPIFEKGSLTEFNSNFVKAVRSIDQDTLIFYEPEIVSSLGFPSYVSAQPFGEEVHDPNLSLSYHYYPYLTNNTFQPLTAAATVAQRIALANTNGDGVLMTEFGANDDYDLLSNELDAYDDFNLGWMYWAWYSTEPNLDPSDPGEITKLEEGLVNYPQQSPTGTNLHVEKLEVLARPFAYILAGTPIKTNWNAAERIWTYTYSTARPKDQANIHSGQSQQSNFIVMSRNYPNGFNVQVDQGNQILPSNDTMIVVIQANPSARQVTVTITPK